MKLVIAMLFALFVLLQYELWFAEGGLLTIYHLHHDIALQKNRNQKLHQQNQILVADIEDLKHGKEAVESHARYDLGMVKQGEVFYQQVAKK